PQCTEVVLARNARQEQVGGDFRTRGKIEPLAVVVAHRHGAGGWPELQVIGARSRQVHRSQGKRIPPLRVSGIAGKKALAQADAAQPQTVFPLRGNKLAVAQGYFSIAIQAGVPSRGSGIPATTTVPRLPA